MDLVRQSVNEFSINGAQARDEIANKSHKAYYLDQGYGFKAIIRYKIQL